MCSLTPAQTRCLDTIRRLSAGGTAPSYDEIAEALGCGKTTVHRHVHALARAGRIRLTPGHHRGIVLASSLGAEVGRLVALHGGAAVCEALEPFFQKSENDQKIEAATADRQPDGAALSTRCRGAGTDRAGRYRAGL